jgi:hypothetical protein
MESLASTNRASPVMNVKPRPTPNRTIRNIANGSTRRSRTATQSSRPAEATVPASSATYSLKPSARAP